MANILLDQTRWTDGNSASPPSIWTGSAYDFVGYDGNTNSMTATAEAGDTVSFSLNSTIAITSPPADFFAVYVNGSIVYSFPATSTGTDTFVSADLSAGDALFITANTQNVAGYACDITITPTPEPVPPPTPPCRELGRITRSFVSGYTASRLETRRIRRFSKRCCVADFNGAMPLGVTITSVNFETTSPWSLFMSNPRIESTGRKVAVDVSFNFAGYGGLLVTATWSNGEVTNVEFGFRVVDQPLYPSATYPSLNGPYILTATA